MGSSDASGELGADPEDEGEDADAQVPAEVEDANPYQDDEEEGEQIPSGLLLLCGGLGGLRDGGCGAVRHVSSCC